MRTSKPITVTLGDLQVKVDERAEVGRVQLCERSESGQACEHWSAEEAALDEILRQQNPGGVWTTRAPDIPADEVFERRGAQTRGAHEGAPKVVV